MVKEIKMPAGGQTTDVSTVVSWHVKEGDTVKRGDILLEIETDKATMSIESFAAGTVLKICLPEGESGGEGTVLCMIGDANDKIPDAASGASKEAPAADTPAPAAPAKAAGEYRPIDRKSWQEGVEDTDTLDRPKAAAAPAASPAFAYANIKAMPNAKLLAKEKGISLSDVAAFTGKDTLKKSDVESFINNGTGTKVSSSLTDQIIPMTNMRKVIARRMSESASQIPVFMATIEVDMTECIKLRETLKTRGTKVSYNDIIIKCAERAIPYYPMINSSLDGDNIIVHKSVNFGLAVALDAGLVVPVVKDVQNKTISQIAQDNADNVKKAREGKLGADGMSGGTITLSNLGIFPIQHFTAIINPPEVCILALGEIATKPVCIGDEIAARPVMTVTASFDHRIIDGAYGAGYLSKLKEILEMPSLGLA